MRPTLATILPAGIAFFETDGTSAPDPLLPEEAALVVNAVPRRQAEFALSRTCARRALAQLGFTPGSIPVLPTRAPAWPQGVTGSITHCEGYTAAAVAKTHIFQSIGIDAELNQPLPPETRSMIASPAEFDALAALPDIGIHWDRLLFSAKESIFKAWSPLTGTWLDFLNADVRIDPATASFHAEISAQHPRGFTSVEGTFASGGAHLITAICLRT